MVRRLVLIVVILAVALAVALLSRTDEDGRGAHGEVLRHDGAAESPSFESDAAPSRPVVALTDTAPLDGATAAVHADEAGLRITVLHFDGVPATCSVVVVVPSAGEPWRALTDAAGVASGPALGSDGEVWVDGAMPRAWSFPLTTGRGALTLTLPPGEILDGHVLVDGEPPREPFALVVQPTGEGPEESQAIRKLLARPELGLGAVPWQCGQLIQGDGAFRFSGLRADWSGFFILPVAVVAEAGESLDLAAPERRHVLRLRRVPRVLLRVLLPSGEPAPQAGVRVMIHDRDSDEGQTSTDNAGRASFLMSHWEPTTSFDLEIVDAAASARASLSRTAVDTTHDLDLGDVQLEQAWTVTFRAIDPRGVPIAGALGATECGQLMQSEPTGVDGVGRLSAVPIGCLELRVGAARCDIVRVPLPGPPPAEPIDVVLSPCASLDVQVVVADQRPRPGLTLHLSTVLPAAEWSHEDFDHVVRKLGTTRYPWSSHSPTKAADGTYLLEQGRDYPMPASGLFALGCLPPGIPIALQLVDRTRHALWRQDVTPQPGEPALLRIELADLPGTLDVLVTDAAGAPLEQAHVRAFAVEPVSSMEAGRVEPLDTDATGRVHVEELYAPTVLLECAHDGYATSRVTAQLAAGLAHVVLSRGQSVTVHFVDEQGRPVPVREAHVARTDGQPLKQVMQKLDADPDDDLPPADWRFDDLPDAPLTVTTYVGGHRFDWPLDPHVPDMRCTLPVMGSIVVRGLRGADMNSRLVAESTLADEERMYAWPGPEDLQADQVRWPVVLPGRYRVVLEVKDPDREDGSRVPRGSAFVEVRAGEEATAVLP